MTSKVFSAGTVIDSPWLNDVNAAVYNSAQVDVRTFGAVGNGVTDDTAALQTALSSSKNLLFPSGLTFLTGPLTCTVPDKLLSGFGATLKLKAGSTAPLLSLFNGGNTVLGLTFDCNNIAQIGLLLTGSKYTVLYNTCNNFTGISIAAIYSTGNGSGLKIQSNKLISTNTTATITYGIYVECLTSGASKNQITNNEIDVSANPKGLGIYVTGTNDLVYKQTKALISQNIITGTQTPTGTPVGITYRGIQGNVSNNQVSGFNIGISCDISTECVISNNTTSAVGSTSLGIEVNGYSNIISNNQITGGERGISLTVDGTTQPNMPNLDNNVISNNVIINPLSYGVYINASNGKTAYYNSIQGNTIKYVTVGTSRIAVYLAANVLYSLIQGNILIGPGSGQANGTAVFLDTGPFYTSILNNKIEGFERPVRLYSAGALAYTYVTFAGNDVTRDSPAALNSFVLTGAATFGVGCSQVNNLFSNNQKYDVFDLRATVNTSFLIGSGSPSGVVTAGPGSIYLNNAGGATTTLYIHENAGVNTTWQAK